ncbi:hypothetical protein AXF42_Ash002130 [Apostasia shenzhenica]|uniref:Uncharacterized protein n=1 Tax=Apostasia shenzhenica TaxID=1088818 RepID=A0A2I0AMN9_9ASPA|nr:hypothetical protein AXF42_Ash002130 [Apostasia shenzhenica]
MTEIMSMSSMRQDRSTPRNKPEWLSLIIQKSRRVCTGSISSRILVRNHSDELLLSDSTATTTNRKIPLLAFMPTAINNVL